MLIANTPYIKPDDMFYFAVLCKDITYSNFKYWNEAPNSLDVPDVFTSPCSTPDERLDFVHKTMKQVLRGEISKPEWMLYVEMEATCNGHEVAPSTFLALEAKDEKYTKLGEKLLDFLYSVNLIDCELSLN